MPGIRRLSFLALLALAGCGEPYVGATAALVGEWSCDRPPDDVAEFNAVERLSADGSAHLTLTGRYMRQGRLLRMRVDFHADWRRTGNVIAYESVVDPEMTGRMNGDPVPIPQDALAKFEEWTKQSMYQTLVSVTDDELAFHGRSPDILWTCRRAAKRVAVR